MIRDVARRPHDGVSVVLHDLGLGGGVEWVILAVTLAGHKVASCVLCVSFDHTSYIRHHEFFEGGGNRNSAWLTQCQE